MDDRVGDDTDMDGIFGLKKDTFSGCANDSNCPGFDSVCDPLDNSNCSFCDNNNNCTGGKYPNTNTSTNANNDNDNDNDNEDTDRHQDVSAT